MKPTAVGNKWKIRVGYLYLVPLVVDKLLL